MATESKSLKTAVDKEVKQAETEAKTGDVKTTKAPPVPSDLPTGTRRFHPPT